MSPADSDKSYATWGSQVQVCTQGQQTDEQKDQSQVPPQSTISFPSECPICCVVFHGSSPSSIKTVTCFACSETTCLTCHKTYILGSLLEAHCMFCKTGWGLYFLLSNFPKTWVNGTGTTSYRTHRKTVMLDRERSLMPETLTQLPKFKQLDEAEQLVRDMLNRKGELHCELQNNRRATDALRTKIRQMKGSKMPDDGKYRVEFICRCPQPECRGMITKSFDCVVCEKRICRVCREPRVKGDGHLCNPDVVQNLRALKEDTKPCPKCAVPIHRISGCLQMFCQHEDTPIWMWDGTKKLARDVRLGDLLIGDDGGPRKVEELCCGEAPMFEIRQRFGSSYKVIESHLLTLLEDKKKVVDISVKDYLLLGKDCRKRGYYRYSTPCIQWPESELPIDPYLLGMWLGERSARTTRCDGFASNDPDLIMHWVEWCRQQDLEITHKGGVGRSFGYDSCAYLIGNSYQGRTLPVGYATMETCAGCKSSPSLCCASESELLKLKEAYPDDPTYDKILRWRQNITPRGSKKFNPGKNHAPNRFICLLRQVGVLDHKGDAKPHVPLSYLRNSEKHRMKLLAGLLDINGNLSRSDFRFCQSTKQTELFYGVVDLVHSLGFVTTVKLLDSDSGGDPVHNSPRSPTITTSAHLYLRIMGDIATIPTTLFHKRYHLPRSNPVSTIKIIPTSEPGRFFGWRVSGGSSRYLLGDGTVTHNCVQCGTAFSWRTGQIDKGVVHNPHAARWIREHGPLNAAPCGGLPAFRTMDTLFSLRNYRERSELMTTLSAIYHLIAYTQRQVDENADHKVPKLAELRTKYALSRITEAQWRNGIFRLERDAERKRIRQEIFGTFYTIALERLLQLVEQVTAIKKINDARNIYWRDQINDAVKSFCEEMKSIKTFINESFLRELPPVGATVVPLLTEVWCWETVTAAACVRDSHRALITTFEAAQE